MRRRWPRAATPTASKGSKGWCHWSKTGAGNARRPAPRPADLLRGDADLQVVGPVDAELRSRLVQGAPQTAVPLRHRFADEPDLDPAETRLEGNGPAERTGHRTEQLAVPRVIGLDQVQDDQGGHGRIVRDAV